MTAGIEAPTNLVDVPTSTLERLRSAIRDKRLVPPLAETELIAFGVGAQLPAVTLALTGHSRAACLAILDATLAERAHATRLAPELVWTGPEAQNATARDTAVVLRGLFESATTRVLLAGYSFSHAHEVLAPLHRAMTERGVTATFFVNIEQVERGVSPDEHARRQIEAFARDSWPFGAPYPELYFDKRALVPGPPYASLHAKCVVVDDERAFLSSANFTQRGQERNIEAGVLIHDTIFAAHLARQWMGLIAAGHVSGVGMPAYFFRHA